MCTYTPRWRFISSPVKIGELCPLAHLQSFSFPPWPLHPGSFAARNCARPSLQDPRGGPSPREKRRRREGREEGEEERRESSVDEGERWETEKERRDGRAHQLMEAAINNAAVVYHSDPRLILPVVPGCQPAGGLFHPLPFLPRRDQPQPSSILRHLAPLRLNLASPPPPTRFGNALAGLRSGRKL